MTTYYGNFTAAQEAALASQHTGDPKASVRAVTTGALPACTYNNGTNGVGATLTANANGALPAQDTVNLVATNRLGVKNQAATLQNGIYTVTSVGGAGAPWVLTRATDADEDADVTSLMTFGVEEGSTPNVGAFYELTTANPITVGVTGLSFSVCAGRTATATNGGAGNAGRFLALDGNGKAAGVVLEDLGSTGNGKGLSLLGLEDAGGLYDGVNGESAFAEIRTTLRVAPHANLTIANGVVAVTRTHHWLDTEGGAAFDDLTTITGMAEGQFLLLELTNPDHNVVLRHNVGGGGPNIKCPYGKDITLDGVFDQALCFFDGTAVIVTAISLASGPGGGLGALLAAANGSDLVTYTRANNLKNKIADASATVTTSLNDLDDALWKDFTARPAASTGDPLANPSTFVAGGDTVVNSAAETAFANVIVIPQGTAPDTKIAFRFVGDVFLGTGGGNLYFGVRVGPAGGPYTVLFQSAAADPDTGATFGAEGWVIVGTGGTSFSAFAQGHYSWAVLSPMLSGVQANAAMDFGAAPIQIQAYVKWSAAAVDDVADLALAQGERRLVGPVA